MATYGSRDENRFKIPGSNSEYYTLIDSKTGTITVKSPNIAGNVGGANLDRTVGTIEATGSKAKKFQSTPGSTTSDEETLFSSQATTNNVRNQAIKTAIKAQVAEGVTGQVAKARANELINTGTTTTAPVKNTPEQSNTEETVSREELSTASESANKLIEDQALKDGDIRKQYGNWRYPIDFPDNQDRVTFKMFRYNPKTLAVGEDLGVFKDRKKPTGKEIFGSVTLPITPSITDVNTVNWGNDELNGLAALAAATSYSAITGGAEGAAKSIDAIVSGLKSGSGALKTAAAAYFAGEAAGGNKTFLSRVTGAVLNPNMELLFNGPQLRTHSFSFTLSAREEKESQEIRRIIRFFKQGMSVKRASTNLFLKAPNIFDISYHYRSNNEDHPWLNQIKTCALTSCQVNYTPAGNYATYYDGSMTSYEITLSFSELDPIFEDDYKNDNDTSIGY